MNSVFRYMCTPIAYRLACYIGWPPSEFRVTKPAQLSGLLTFKTDQRRKLNHIGKMKPQIVK